LTCIKARRIAPAIFHHHSHAFAKCNCTMLTRRQFLKVGLAGGALLLAVRAAYGPFSRDPHIAEDREYAYAILGSKERTLLAALVPVVLAGALPSDPSERPAAVAEVVRGVDRAVSGLPPSVQQEVGQLFALLGFAPTRRLLAGVASPWLTADPDTIAAFLDRWRASSFVTLRSAYRAIQELIMAGWYGNSISWARIGYPGPPPLSR
jgi:hypothetical protein